CLREPRNAPESAGSAKQSGRKTAGRMRLRDAGGTAKSRSMGPSSPFRQGRNGEAPMSRLYLLRHAKAKWAEPGSRDYDRALELSGRADADGIAASMLLAGHMPGRVLCSGAKRARETWEVASRHLPVT